MRRNVPLAALLLLAILAGLPAASAHANASQLSIMMDDDQLIYRGDTAREAAMQRMKALGVDYVRVTVLWDVVAHRMKKSQRKNADKPKAYPKPNWDRYDALVRSGRRNGIGIYLNVTGPGPGWAMGKPPKSMRKYADTWKPDPREFFKFVKAVGRRYDGTYKDENSDRSKLPRVAFWSIYNEPNQPGWLTPQFQDGKPYSPIMYRDLWYYGRTALDATGHKQDVVLIGETAPLGTGNTKDPSPMFPKQFIREFFCVSKSNRKYTGASAKLRRCSTVKRIQPLRYFAWAHHPYTKELRPKQRDPHRDAITMANIGELPALLQRMPVKKEGFAGANFAALTEFGYETNPPDPFSGVSYKRQAEDINVGDYLAYKEPRVISNAQFLLRDVKGINKYPKSKKEHWFTYQSGLFTNKGKAKPSAVAYRFPLVKTAGGANSTSFWGQLRFLPAGVKTEIAMQFKPAGTSDYETVGTPVPVNNASGFFETTQSRAGAGTWRAVFTNPYSGLVVGSREVPTS